MSDIRSRAAAPKRDEIRPKEEIFTKCALVPARVDEHREQPAHREREVAPQSRAPRTRGPALIASRAQLSLLPISSELCSRHVPEHSPALQFRAARHRRGGVRGGAPIREEGE